MAYFTFTINGNTYTSDPANVVVPDGYRFIKYGYVTALANLAVDIVAVTANAITSTANSAAAAAASALTALNAPGTTATSATSLTIGPGAQALAIQTGKSLVAGMPIMCAVTASPSANYMHGVVDSYNSGTGALLFTPDSYNGSGTYAAWTVSIAGVVGAEAGAVRIEYTFSTTTTDADPGTGVLRLDNATQNIATTIRADLADRFGVDMTSVLGTLTSSTSVSSKGTVRLVKKGDPTKFLLLNVTAMASPVGYRNITVSVQASSGASPFANGDLIVLHFSRTGDMGASGGATASGAYTYLSGAGAVIITPTAPGQYVTLDVGTNFLAKGVQGSIGNGSNDIPLGIRDSTGTALGWLKPGKKTMVDVVNNGTAAGQFSLDVEKMAWTAQFNNTSITNSGTATQRITIDATRTAFIFGGTTIYVLVYDSSQPAGSQWGAPTSIRTGIGVGQFAAALSGAAQLLVVSCDGTTGMEAVTITLTGGTGVNVNTANKGTATLAGNIASLNNGNLVSVGATWAAPYTRSTSTSAVRGITVAGNTPTIGAELALSGNGGIVPNVYQVDATHGLAISSDNTTMYYKPFSIVGATYTGGTQASDAATLAGFKTMALGSGRWLCLFINSTSFASLISVNTGTNTATKSSATFGTAATSSSTIDPIAISNTKVCVGYQAGTAVAYSNIITDNAGAISNGTEASIALNSAASTVAAVGLSGTTALFAVKAGNYLGSLSIDCSGASPSFTSVAALPGAGVGPTTSDSYCNRDRRMLVAGNAAYTPLAINTNGWGTRFAANSVRNIQPVDLPLNSGGGGAAGATSSESWFTDTFSQTGVMISKVEAAA